MMLGLRARLVLSVLFLPLESCARALAGSACRMRHSERASWFGRVL